MSEQYQIESDALIVEVNASGAEMKKLYAKASNKDLLWPGLDDVWSRSAPVLFPIVGKLIDNEYTLKGKIYSMTQHGFARDTEFKCVAKSNQEIEFQMIATQKTFESYPFCFQLNISYKLEGNILKISHFVKNDDRQDILFSIGAHPGFITANLADFDISFEDLEQEYYRLNKGCVNWEKKILLNDSKISLTPEFFLEDAMIFKKMKSKYIDLINNKTQEFLRVKSDAPYWGIWGKGEVPFVCIEPWFGVADVCGHQKNFEHKEGIIKLAQGDVFEFTYSIEYGSGK